MTIRLTTGQAVVRFMMNQHVEHDGETHRFFAGCWGIFGHGNIGGVAQGLQEVGPEFPFYLARNEQSMVHTAIGFSKMANRHRAFACLTSIGPGATNMITGAATATINRIPVLLLTGDSFAERVQDPVLQQLVSEHDGTVSASDAFRPVVRYFDRISRPEQLIASLPEAMRVLTSPADTGAVCITIPQDVQTFAFEFPEEIFQPRTWVIARQRPDEALLARAAEWIRGAQRPMIIAGGGVRYSEATDTVRDVRRAARHPGRSRRTPARAPWRSTIRSASAAPALPARAAPTSWPSRPTSSSASALGTPTSSPRPRRRSSMTACGSSTSTCSSTMR